MASRLHLCSIYLHDVYFDQILALYSCARRPWRYLDGYDYGASYGSRASVL